MPPPDACASSSSGLMADCVVEPEHRVHRPAAGRDDAQRDQGVHRAGAAARQSDRGPVEWPGGPARHRKGKGNQQPLPASEPIGGIERQQHGQVAQRHKEDKRDSKPPPQVAHLSVVVAGDSKFGLAGPYRLGRIARSGNRVEKCLFRHASWQGYGGNAGGEIDRGNNRRARGRQAFLDSSCAGGAGHALDRQGHLAARALCGSAWLRFPGRRHLVTLSARHRGLCCFAFQPVMSESLRHPGRK